MYLGFDRPAYPGDDVMASLRATGRVSFVAVHLGPAPTQPSTAWMSHIAELVTDGWGLHPVYAGQQAPDGPVPHVLTANQGTADARDAAALAACAGLAANSVVYLDVAAAARLSAAHLAYVRAWVEAMRAGSYRPGVHCAARQTAAQLAAQMGRLPTRVFRTARGEGTTVDLDAVAAPDPIGSGYPQALVWQYRIGPAASRIDLSWTDGAGLVRTLTGVDLDAAVVADPSNPVLPFPVITDVTPTGGSAGDTVRITGVDLVGVTDVAFGTVTATGVAVVDDATVTTVVPRGLSGEIVRIAVTNRWGLSGETGESFGVDLARGS